jgi:hypothetical protein
MKNRLAMTHMSHAFQRSSSQLRQQFAMFFQTPNVARKRPVSRPSKGPANHAQTKKRRGVLG